MKSNRTNRYRAHAATRRPGDMHTVASFCASNAFSVSTYYGLKREGRGPEEIEVNGRILISPESEDAWRRRMALETARRRLERAERKLTNEKQQQAS